MNEEFVPFELAKKLKEKGFEIPTRSIVAMYNEQGVFFTLTTAADYQVSPSGYKYRCYYDYDDFDEHDYIAPTISQVLKWLREEKYIAINIEYTPRVFQYKIVDMSFDERFNPYGRTFYTTYEDAALDGIKYVVDNLI